MSELGDTFKEWRDWKSQKKRKNLEDSTKILTEKGVLFDPKNDGLMLIVHHLGKKIVFYPSTGLSIDAQGIKRRGVFSLLRVLGK